MTKLKIIQMCAVLELTFILMSVLTAFYFEPYLPSLLQEYLAQEFKGEPALHESIAYSILLIALVLHIVSIFGIFTVKKWARNLFIISTIAIFPTILFIGPNVDHAVSYTCNQLAVLSQGMLLAIFLFTDMYREDALNE